MFINGKFLNEWDNLRNEYETKIVLFIYQSSNCANSMLVFELSTEKQNSAMPASDTGLFSQYATNDNAMLSAGVRMAVRLFIAKQFHHNNSTFIFLSFFSS